MNHTVESARNAVESAKANIAKIEAKLNNPKDDKHEAALLRELATAERNLEHREDQLHAALQGE